MHLPPREGLTHNLYYYYRVLGEWERLESPTDTDLYARLFVPRHHAVTLIFPDDYETFLHRIGQPEFGAELRAVAERLQDPTLIANEPVRPLQAASLPAALSVEAPGTTRSSSCCLASQPAAFRWHCVRAGQAFEAELASAVDTAAAGP